MKWFKDNWADTLRTIWELWFGGTAIYFVYVAIQNDSLSTLLMAGLAGFMAFMPRM